jgi:peroxiredoxin
MGLTTIVFLTAEASLYEVYHKNFKCIEIETASRSAIWLLCGPSTTIIATRPPEQAMVEVTDGDSAPAFTAPVVEDGIGSFSLSDRLEEAPVVLAFFPVAFTGTCTNELVAFQGRLESFEEAGATVYGVSVDSPFALSAFRDRHDLEFGLISDFEKTVIDRYGVRDSFPDLGVYGLAKRSVFVVDGEGTVTYRWVSDDPSIEPDYEAVLRAVEG